MNKFQEFMIKVLQKYTEDKQCSEIIQFPTNLNGSMRKIVHNIADDLKLGHKSRGKKKNKRLCIYKSKEDFQRAINLEQKPKDKKKKRKNKREKDKKNI